MIRDLLTPEAHRDPYVWSSVLLAHFALGAILWPVVGWWIVPAYIAFEAVQAIRSRHPLWWDSVCDSVAVLLGAQLMAGHWLAGPIVLAIAAVGWRARV